MPQDKLIRHRPLDRALHWGIALCLFILLATGLLPQFGVNFDWVPIHWISGLALSLLVLVHTLRSLLWKDFRLIWFQGRDFSTARPGKYSLAQKLMHNAVALLALAAIISGLLMMVRIDTPFWERNPYWLEASAWGYIYVAHGLAALMFVAVIMLHIYFSLRPEKRLYLRAMVFGWVRKKEYFKLHERDD